MGGTVAPNQRTRPSKDASTRTYVAQREVCLLQVFDPHTVSEELPHSVVVTEVHCQGTRFAAVQKVKNCLDIGILYTNMYIYIFKGRGIHVDNMTATNGAIFFCIHLLGA